MAGHSKWSTIKRKKGALDQKRGKLFSNISKEITVSSRLGGKDIDSNPRLRQAVKKAKALNMPNSNIDKAIKKGVGELDNVIIEEVSYEGYGPFGVAIIIEAITDNKNRTVADIRHALSKFGGSLGQAGSVSWNFERNGIILIDKNEISEGDIFEFSIENDCIEFFEDDDCYRLNFHSNELYNKLDLLEKLLQFLDDLEDVQNVFSNQTLGQS